MRNHGGRVWRAEGSGGFTLIEVIAALVVFAVGVLMAAGLTTSLSIQMQTSSLRTEMVANAQERLEEVMREPYAALTPGTTDQSIQLQGRGYTQRLSVSQVDPHLRAIEVSLIPDQLPAPSYRIVTYRADR